ncbi:MAG: hypothetical protein HZB26_15330 [Candidatus Hydrogenedentes bacterium]|nr:hypothetical protein [Candidatus Hydrogenedentota bacterium]
MKKIVVTGIAVAVALGLFGSTVSAAAAETGPRKHQASKSASTSKSSAADKTTTKSKHKKHHKKKHAKKHKAAKSSKKSAPAQATVKDDKNNAKPAAADTKSATPAAK